MSIIKNKLESLNIILPPAPAPAANYVPTVKSGNLIFVSGQIPVVNGNMIVGKVGHNIEIEEAVAAARACGLAIIAQLNEATNSNLDKISQIVKLGGFVNSTSEYKNHPKIINGASVLLVKIFGNQGKHTRFAVGSNSLPMDMAVEIEAIIKIK